MRHATYYRRWLEQAGIEWSTLSTGVERAPHFAGLNNVRAALEWCFGVNDNTEIGVGLAAAAAPVFLTMSLLPECHRWSERAILALDDATRGGSEEMHLRACLGISSMHMLGQSDAARMALDRSLAIAEEHGDVLSQAALLGMLHMFHFRGGDFNTALHHAKRCRAVAGTIEDPAATALAHSILGRSLHLMGDHSGARVELEASLRNWLRTRRTTIYLAYDRHYPGGHRPGADIVVARLSGSGDGTCARDVLYVPELLRVKGGLLLSMPRPSVEDAEKCFMQSLELSRRQGARAWELRTAVDLATLLADQGRRENGRALLQPVFEQFVEGWDTADLKAAKRELSNLG